MKTRVRCLLILLIILGWIILALPPYVRTVHASTTITFRPPTADNWLQQDNADANMGNSTELHVRSHSGKNCRAIVKFDMSGIIPDGATVISATLSLRYWEYDGTNPSDRTYKVYRLTQTAWTEGGSTWNKYDGTNSWTSLGGDYTTADASSASVPSRTPSWMNWTVTAQVQYAVNNVGKVAHLLIRDQTEDAATQYLAKFRSKEYATPGLRPKLDVTYAVIDRIVFTSAPQVLTTGTPSAIMIIQTQDASGAVNVPSDTTISLTSTSGTGKFSLSTSPWSDITSVTITAGSSSANFYYKDTTTGTPTITAAESPSKGWTSATQQETVNPAGGNKLVIAVSSTSVAAGSWTTVCTVQRQDQYGNPATSGSTTVNLASSSTGVNKKFAETSGGPAVTFVTIPDGASTKDFYYYDEKAGSWTISVSATGLTGDSKTLTVNPGNLASFTMTGYPSSLAAGQSFGGNDVVVTAKDAYGNVKTDYTGQVYFTSTDPQAVLPYTSGSKYQFVVGDHGVHTFAGTGFSLKTVGSQTITVTDGTVSKTSSPITVSVGALDHIVVSPKSATVSAGGSQAYTAEAFDAYGNSLGVVTSDPLTSWSIQSGAGGSWAANVYTSEKAGTWTVTGTYSSKSDTATLTVNAASLDHFTFDSISSPQTAGTAFSVRITAEDAYGNTVTSYTGTNMLTDSTGTISPTSTGAFTSGVWTGSVAIAKPQTSVTITTIGDGKSGTSNAFDVSSTSVTVETATGTGLATFSPDAGLIVDLIAASESTLPPAGKPNLFFPHGFFSFRVRDLNVGQTVTVTITLPSAVATGTQYWKYHTPKGWIDVTSLLGDDDGDNVLTLTLTDGGLGDDDGIANGQIVDQGGPGHPPPRPDRLAVP